MAFGLVQAIDGPREQPEVAVDGAHAALGVGDGVTTGEWRQLLKEDLRGRRVAEPRAGFGREADPKEPRVVAIQRRELAGSQLLELGARLGDLAEVEQETDQHRPEHGIPGKVDDGLADSRLLLAHSALLASQEEAVHPDGGQLVAPGRDPVLRPGFLAIDASASS